MKYLIIFLTLFVSIGLAAFPRPIGYVNDFANVLTDTQTLEQELVAYEKNTTIEISLVTIDSLPQDQTLATYAVEMFQEWGIGKKGEDNGILVIFVKNGTVSNRMRIELGYGIQGYVTGAEAGRMLDNALPFYQAGDYQRAAESILIDLSDQLVNYVPGKPAVSNQGDFIDVIFPVLSSLPFIIVIIASVSMSNRCPYCLKGKVKCSGDYCVCQKCGRKFKKKKRYAPFLVAGGGFGGGSGGGFGGFGGGGSGGGGAGR